MCGSCQRPAASPGRIPDSMRTTRATNSEEGVSMITVKLFGMTKLLAGNESTLTVALAKGHSVKNLIELVNKRYPKIGELIQKKKILVSVNQEIAHEDTKVQEGDEVALLPPFAGGSQSASGLDDSQLVRVQQEDFSIDTELKRVRSRSKRIGGIAMFLGTARDRSQGRDVDGITFE